MCMLTYNTDCLNRACELCCYLSTAISNFRGCECDMLQGVS